MRIRAGREISGLNPMVFFDKRNENGLLEYYVRPLIEEYTSQDLKEWALEHRKRFELVPPYPLNANQIREKFEARARAEALTILEQERRNIVEYLTPSMTDTLNRSIKRLKGIVYGANGKIKKIHAQVPVSGNYTAGNPTLRDIYYTEGGGTELLDIIGKIGASFGGLYEYVPYMSPELRALWNEAEELASLETIEKEEAEKAEKEPKTEGQASI